MIALILTLLTSHPFAALFVAGAGVLGFAATCVPPLKSRPSTPNNNFQVIRAGGVASGFVNQAFVVSPPVRTLLLLGNDANGAVNVFLSFGPIPGDTTGPANQGVTVIPTFRFMPTQGGDTSHMKVLSFRHPISGTIYISAQDSGQPGSFYTILASDDYLPGTGVVVNDKFSSAF